ncbi:MAG: amidase [Pseudomonadota bacterium]
MTTFPEYGSFDALALANLVQRGVVSPVELLDAAIERAEQWNPHINAIIYKMYDAARQAAQAKIPKGPFSGVPFLLKDLLADYGGVPLSSGSRFTQHWVPKRDSELVTSIKQAGLIVFGKTNTPEFGLSSVTEPVLFGPTRNPWNLAHSPGGSSGGSAAAVAAGIVPMAHGNDGGGSIRIPASYCGLFGLKPSRGRTAVGSEILRMWESMVVEHVLTRSVRDSAAMLDVLSGHGLEQSPALPKMSGTFLSSLSKPLRPLQIALLDQPFFPAPVAPDYAMSVHQAGTLCQQLGHSVEIVAMKINSADVARAYLTMISGEIAASLKRFAVAMKTKLKSRDIERQTMLINHIGQHLSAAEIAWAHDVLETASLHMAQFFSDYDVLMTPTMAAPAPLIGELKPDIFEQGILELLTHVPFAPLLHKALDHAALRNFAYYPFTPIFNVSGQPAMSVPMYWDAQQLPIGIQFAARYGEELLLLQLAQQIEEAQPWFAKQPVFAES